MELNKLILNVKTNLNTITILKHDCTEMILMMHNDI